MGRMKSQLHYYEPLLQPLNTTSSLPKSHIFTAFLRITHFLCFCPWQRKGQGGDIPNLELRYLHICITFFLRFDIADPEDRFWAQSCINPRDRDGGSRAAKRPSWNSGLSGSNLTSTINSFHCLRQATLPWPVFSIYGGSTTLPCIILMQYQEEFLYTQKAFYTSKVF